MQASSTGIWVTSLSRRHVNWFFIGLWGLNVFFLITNLLLTMGWEPPLNTIGRQLNLDTPASLGKWWLSAQLLLLSAAAMMLAATPSGRSRFIRYGWPVFAAITALMSADSVARMRQDVEGAFREHLGTGQVLGVQINWTMLLAPFIIASSIFFFAFARRVLSDVPKARTLAVWGIVAWILSIVMEVVECGFLFGRGVALQVRAFEPTVEQMLEVGGTTLLLMALAELGFANTARREGKVRAGDDAGAFS